MFSKKTWIKIAHLAVIGGGIAGVIVFPPAATLIVALVGSINGSLPSPFAKSEPKPEEPKP